jgi:fructose 1,6-bisphosphate aldolase/phosphatase
MARKLTLTVIKGDVGSKAGHTEPDEEMMQVVRDRIAASGLVIDYFVGHAGDDINMIFTHTGEVSDPKIHKLGWDALKAAGDVAEAKGYYGAYQDLLVDAPSHNLRGAGPGVAELTFEHDPVKENTNRPRETFLVFAGDKLGPGVFNVPIGYAFMYPYFNGGLLLKSSLRQGFVMRIVDMDQTGDSDSVIDLNIPEDNWKIETLLRDPDRFAIKAIYSRYLPGEQVASFTTTRLHNIAGKYVGKDDPAGIVRTQLNFPAPELVLPTWKLAHYSTGDAMGFHNRAVMPMPWNSSVRGDHCQPIMQCCGFSMDREGRFAHSFVDFFAGAEWDDTRAKALMKSALLAEQGFHGNALAARGEQAYTGVAEAEQELLGMFRREEEPVAVSA